jgi:hypothetical protein
MKNLLRSTHLYILVAVFMVGFVKPVQAALILSDLNGDTVLYDAGRGFYILPVFNFGGLVFTGDSTQRLTQAQTFASEITYGAVKGWKVHRGCGPYDGSCDGTFSPGNEANVDLAFDNGIFGDVNTQQYGFGVGGDVSFYNDCQATRYDIFDSFCQFQTPTAGRYNHAIYEIYAADFIVIDNPGPSENVPAPNSLTLIGLGLLGLVRRRFKKQTI